MTKQETTVIPGAPQLYRGARTIVIPGTPQLHRGATRNLLALKEQIPDRRCAMSGMTKVVLPSPDRRCAMSGMTKQKTIVIPGAPQLHRGATRNLLALKEQIPDRRCATSGMTKQKTIVIPGAPQLHRGATRNLLARHAPAVHPLAIARMRP